MANKRAVLLATVLSLAAWYLAEKPGRSFAFKDIVVLETAVICPSVGPKQIDGLTETMFKSATDGILLLVLARRNR